MTYYNKITESTRSGAFDTKNTNLGSIATLATLVMLITYSTNVQPYINALVSSQLYY
jgi:hypothetical protein